MSKEITQGRINRYLDRYDSLGYKLSLDLSSLGRKKQLKLLRDIMSKTRNQLRRMGRRSMHRV